MFDIDMRPLYEKISEITGVRWVAVFSSSEKSFRFETNRIPVDGLFSCVFKEAYVYGYFECDREKGEAAGSCALRWVHNSIGENGDAFLHAKWSKDDGWSFN